MKLKSVKIFGLKGDPNFGDGVILDSTKYLFLNKKNELDVQILDVFYERKFSKIDKLLNRGSLKFKKYNIFNRIVSTILWRLSPNGHYKLKRYLLKNVETNSAVIFAGGGIIKYKVQDFSNEVYQILKYCDKRNIPVFFNSVGVEGYDKTKISSRRFEKALKMPCVKLLSTRDALELLEKYRPGFPCRQVCDPAVWANDAYGVKKCDTNVVGIGLIRENIFMDYGVKVTPAQLLDFYCDLVKIFKKNNIRFEFFTNGLSSDGNIIEKINQRLNESFVVNRPKTEKALVEIISKYNFTITSRLHATIISYAFDISNIALVWNNKIKYFCDLTNDEQYTYVETKNIEANNVFNIYMAKKDGIVRKNNSFKNSILDNIDYIISYLENK